MNDINFKQQTFAPLAVFLISVFIFTAGLYKQEFIGFESRFALFVLEMLRHGVTWFPTTYQKLYPDYPVSLTLFMCAFAKLMGPTKLALVLPTSITAALVTMFTFLIGKTKNNRWGWTAVFLLMLTNIFVMEARTISSDQFVTLCTTICFYLCCKNIKNINFFSLLFFLGFAFRGPIGLVIPASVVCSYYLLDQSYQRLMHIIFIAIITLIFSCVILFGMAYLGGGVTFMHDVLVMQLTGRLAKATLPWTYYLTTSFGAYAISYPLAIIVALFFWQKKDKKFISHLLMWAGIIVIGLSIPGEKKIRYILSSAPAFSLIAAYIWQIPKSRQFLFYIQYSLNLFFSFLPLICLIGLFIFLKKYPTYVIPAHLTIIPAHPHVIPAQAGIHNKIELFILIILQIISLAVISAQHLVIPAQSSIIPTQHHSVIPAQSSVIPAQAGIHNKKTTLFPLIIAVITFISFYIIVIEPITLRLNETKPFVTMVENIRQKKHGELIFYKINPDAIPIKYLINVSEEVKPIFIFSQKQLLQFRNAIILTYPEYYVDDTSFEFITEGRIGHDRIIVFTTPCRPATCSRNP